MCRSFSNAQVKTSFIPIFTDSENSEDKIRLRNGKENYRKHSNMVSYLSYKQNEFKNHNKKPNLMDKKKKRNPKFSKLRVNTNFQIGMP